MSEQASRRAEPGGVSAAQYQVDGYRWVVLAVFMLVNLTIQVLWIACAPISHRAAAYYHVSDLKVGLLAMSFMLAFIPLSLPAAWVIDTRGFRAAVGFGAVLMGVFGVARGLARSDYSLALACTIGIAVAQPFLLNAWTKVAANWFPQRERATAVGLVTLASLVGTGLGMVLSPVLSDLVAIGTMQLVYGGLAAASAAAFLLLARERPATPPCPPGMDDRALVLDGLRNALHVRPFLAYLAVVFVGMGVFNGVSTWVEEIVRPRGFSAGDAGSLGALMLFGGLIGAVALSALSDRRARRVRYLVLGLALSVPGLLGLAFADSLWLLLLSGFELGFFLVSAMPIGMQFAAEVTWPTPEGTSNGLIQLFGQGSVAFVYLMAALRADDGAFTASLLLAALLLSAGALLMSRQRDAAPQRAGSEPEPAPEAVVAEAERGGTTG